jgi:hypothetical protein
MQVKFGVRGAAAVIVVFSERRPGCVDPGRPGRGR